jgi:transcriptional regulator GlxA family with amidase domain
VRRSVVLLAYPGVGALDVTGPAEVFAVADRVAGGEAYAVAIVSTDGEDVVSSSGMRLGVAGALAGHGPVDTLLVPGGAGWRQAVEHDRLVESLRAAAARSRRVASVCTGAFLLGAVGLLDGRRATTHWELLDELAARCPAATVEREPIFVQQGSVFTSAGVTAGIDLALALVEADHGAALARTVAQRLVVFMQRPGGQAQFSARMRVPALAPSPLRTLLDEIAADPAGDHRVEALAARAGFSERHLARVFTRELGMTPARYVELVRVEAARALLEGSDVPLETIARHAGLRSAETLRRTFARELGVTPHAYRRRFRSTGVVTPATG